MEKISPLESWILWLTRRVKYEHWVRTALTEVYKEGYEAGRTEEQKNNPNFQRLL